MGTALSRLVRSEFAAEDDGAPTEKAWYHGDITDKKAENRLALYMQHRLDVMEIISCTIIVVL